MNDKCIDVDLYQSIEETYGPNNTVLSMEVSLFERVINTHLGTSQLCCSCKKGVANKPQAPPTILISHTS